MLENTENLQESLLPTVRAIFERIQGSPALLHTGIDEEVIKVHNFTSKAGTFYEKVRYLLDYKDEHTIKRSAIARILRRHVVIEGATEVGLPLLQELITGGYLPNSSVPERIAVDVQQIVHRYLALREKISGVPKSSELIIHFAASEISRLLFPTVADEAVLDSFYALIHDRVKVMYDISQEDFDVGIYVACRRGLLKEDNESISYALWLRYSHWDEHTSAEDIQILAQHFAVIQARIRYSIEHLFGWELVPRLKNHSIYFAVLQDMVHKYGMEAETILNNEAQMVSTISRLLQERYARENAKTTKSALRAIFYILCTKVLVAFLLELPYEYYVLGAINYIPLASNVFVHPLLLFFVTRIRPLGEKNTAAVIIGLRKNIHGEDRMLIKIKKPSGGVLGALFSLLYLSLFLIIFGLLILVLFELQFNIASVLLFLFFLTLVSYFGLRIRHNAQAWQVRIADEGTLALLWNVFTLPIVRVGRWLSRTFSSINVVVFFMDFIIETPFKLILGFSDAFTSFLREKREETL